MKSKETPPIWLKVGQVAQMMQLSESSVYRMVRSGEIPVRWVGGRVRIHRSYIEDQKWVSSERTTTIFPQKPKEGDGANRTTGAAMDTEVPVLPLTARMQKLFQK